MLTDPSSPLLFDQNAVRHVLERMRQAEPLGDTPLQRLVWVRQQIEAQGPHSSRAGMELALATTLTTLIADKLEHHRHIEKLAEDDDATREASFLALQRDFSRNNVALEAWSLLYYRYVRIDLNLQVQDIANVLNTYPKLINRRLNYGYQRLTESLSKLETEVRINNRRLWLKLKLPPPGYASLYGVDELINRLFLLLNIPAPPHIIAIVGPGGIGKTTLAHAAASQMIDADRIDDLAWLTLDSPTDYATLLGKLAYALGYLNLTSTSLIELEASLRERLASAYVLIVIDNADLLQTHDTMLGRLDALVAPGRVLITDRIHPTSEAALHLIPITPLDRAASEALLLDYAQMRRITQITTLDHTTLRAINDVIGGNPLVARIIVAHLALLPLDRIIDQIASLNTPGGEALFDYLYSESWEVLEHPARQALLALSLTPAEGVEWADLQSITQLTPSILDDALVNLINLSLVDTVGMPPRYLIHPLTRRFAIQQANTPLWDHVYREMLNRAAQMAFQIASLDGVSGNEAAYAVMLLYHQMQLTESTTQVGSGIMQIYSAARRSGYWSVWQEILNYVINQPIRTHENLPFIARALVELGIVYRWMGQLESAIAALDESIKIFGEQGKFIDQADALHEKGKLYETLNRTGDAYEAYQRSAAAAKRLNAPIVRRRALIGLSGLMTHNDDNEGAFGLLEEAITTLQENEVDESLLSQLGVVLTRLGRVDDGIAAHLQAIDALELAGDLPRLARAYLRIGIAYHTAGQFDKALIHLQAGLPLTRALGDSLAQSRIMTNLGTLYFEQNLWYEAQSAWREALILQGYLNDEPGMATTLYNLGDLMWRLGQATEAVRYIMQAHNLAQQLNLVTLLDDISNHPINSDRTT